MSISVTHLSKIYPGDPPVVALDGVTLFAKRGQILGLIGPSGAGKSTLVRILLGLEEPTSGRVVIEGKVGMVFQHFHLFPAQTVGENVAFPLKLQGLSLNLRRKRALELLEQVGLQEKIDCYPSQLSGGQMQRVAIARALASDCSLLICDEPTSALDPASTAATMELLAYLNRTLGLTLLIISHEMELIKQLCKRVAVLEKGRLIEEGRVADLFGVPHRSGFHQMARSYLGGRSSLVRLFFRGPCSERPILSQMIRQFNVEVNVLLGGIERLHEVTIGNLVIELNGEEGELAKATQFLQSEGVLFQKVRPDEL